MRFEFHADQVWLHSNYSFLAGRVNKGDIHLGDAFTFLVWTPWIPEGVKGTRIGEPTVTYAVTLRVEGIEAYQHSLELLPSGMTGALKLTGAGQGQLRAIDPSASDGFWLLSGESMAADSHQR